MLKQACRETTGKPWWALITNRGVGGRTDLEYSGEEPRKNMEAYAELV